MSRPVGAWGIFDEPPPRETRDLSVGLDLTGHLAPKEDRRSGENLVALATRPAHRVAGLQQRLHLACKE